MIKRYPVLLMPFLVIAFLETLSLEIIYFATRKPISIIANPVIRKFFGEAFTHYPGNLVMLPNLFYYAQIAIYILTGVMLCGIAINIFKNTREGLPVKVKALIKNAISRYLAYAVFGIIVVLSVYILRKANSFVSVKLIRLFSQHIPQAALNFSSIAVSTVLFVLNIVLQVFLVLTIPIIAIYKKSLFGAMADSILLGLRRFVTIFSLILVPFLIYFPIAMLKNISGIIINKTFPEAVIYITMLGIITSIFLDCFIFVCAAQFLSDTAEKKT